MKKRGKIIIANWKMYPETPGEAKDIFMAVRKCAASLNKVITVICPPLIYLRPLEKLAGSKNLFLGAQNTFSEKSGSYTGEVSPSMIANTGGSFVILGHSERRALFNETDDIINKKILKALHAGLKVIICIGEKIRDTHGDYLEFIKNQIKYALANVEGRYMKSIVVAYEPVWAIGKKDTEAMTPRDLHEMSIYIRKVITDLYNPDLTQGVKVVYGGSVSSRNAADIMKQGEVDGLLIGRASLSSFDFNEILKIANDLK